MNPLEQLSFYLRRVERNLRVLTLARGMAVLFGAALLVTVALAMAMNALSFSTPSVVLSRFLLFFVLAAALAFTLVVPLLWLNARRAARIAEHRHPEWGERLLTFVERRDSGDPFLPLLAADALPHSVAAGPNAIAAPSRAWMFGALALFSAALLLWMGMRGPGYFGYGASLLWGISTGSSKPFYAISVEPGDARVRRHSDRIVSAHLNGFFSHQASLFVKYASATRWEETAMRPQADGAAFQFLLVGIPENVDYYVASNGIRSDTSHLTAVDLPQVTHLRVTYRFPRAYGRKDETEDPGGDLRAIRGTIADLDIETDKPLSKGFVVLEDGRQIELTGEGSKRHASLPLLKDGAYHLATPDEGQMVRLTDDYFIEARPDSPPTVTILRPVRDARATPIEEVPVEVQARDDNGVTALDLHYSVNGGAEQVRSLSGGQGKEARGTALLSLEDFKLVPGDVISVYATARDALTTARSDIYFIEARPFELDYHQSQQSGEGGGSGADQPKIAERQKEIIAATFNRLKGKSDAASEAENAKYLAGVQSKLREEAQSLSNRMKARQLEGGSQAIQQFVANMESAIASMAPAAAQLKDKRWNDALSPEQKALQNLLRAEAIFRDIQVQIGRSGGGGGGQSAGATRDLEGLTSLELDTQKNQYESGSQSAQDARQKAADETLRKLEELAKRQQQLAQQQQSSKQNFQQRWEQEMLRREAEQLRQQLEELSRNQDGQQGQQSGQQSQGQGSAGSQQSQQNSQGKPGTPQNGTPQNNSQNSNARNNSGPRDGGRQAQGSRQALENALQRLTEATRDMSDAASHNSQPQAERAAEQLSRAGSELSQMRKEQTGSAMSDAVDQARKLAEKQAAFDERLRHNFAGGAAGNRSDEQNRQLSAEMSEEKNREIDDLHRLEHAMQQTARNLQDTQPDASKKLRDSIGELQQNELESRMRWTADALDKGLGSYAVMREAPVTMGLNQLKERLADASSAMNKNGQPGSGQGLQQALERAEKLRRDLTQMAQSSPGRAQSAGSKPGGQPPGGQQPGNQSGGQQPTGQPSGQPGSQAGAQTSAQTSAGATGGPSSAFSPQGGFGPAGAEAGGSWNAMNLGGARPPDAATTQREYEQAVRELARMGQSIRSDPATAKQIQQLLNEVQALDPRRFNADPQRLAALEQKLFADVEVAELLLRRKVEDEHGNIRTPAPQDVPAGYSNAVAEYFRRLSH